jgi:catechol 2,3-dioxygenase-like lactoylglutathione lyase family enzyme
MDNFYARSVFFVRDGEDALAFYTQTLGFKLDWNNQYEGRASVFQVSLFGFELILNQIYPDTKDRAGHGRVFIGLEENQGPALCQHIIKRDIKAARDDWGRPTLVIKDLDGNELFFWLPESEWARLESQLLEPGAEA